MDHHSRVAQWWGNSLVHRMHLRMAVPGFLKACPDPFRGQVLEIGAGYGWTSRRILETFPQVELTATDINPKATQAFDVLRSTYGKRLKVQQANVFKLPFDRDSFDICIAINVLHQLKSYGVRKAIQEVLRVIRPGGLVGVSNQSFFLFPYTSKDVIIQTFQREGCDVIHMKGGSHYSMWIRKAYPVQ